jgi:hypothetical protein
MPEKKLIQNELINTNGEVCAIGSVGVARGVDLKKIDVYDYETIANVFGISETLVREIEFINDFHFKDEAERWRQVRNWCLKNIKKEDEKNKS